MNTPADKPRRLMPLHQRIRELLEDTMLTDEMFKRMILDVKNGQLEWGKNKNIDLGQLRNAVGQNTAGAWHIGMLSGAGPFVGRVEKKTGQRKDKSEFETREVGRVGPLSR